MESQLQIHDGSGLAFGEGSEAVQIDMFHDVHASGSTVYLRIPEKEIIRVQLMIMDLEDTPLYSCCARSAEISTA